MADIQISGIVYSTIAVTAGTDKQCDLVIKGSTNVTLSSAVTYKHTKTSTVTAVSPSYGPSTGNTVLTITGTNFGTTVTVTIDGISCASLINTDT